MYQLLFLGLSYLFYLCQSVTIDIVCSVPFCRSFHQLVIQNYHMRFLFHLYNEVVLLRGNQPRRSPSGVRQVLIV
jgi:hypothetical protein